VDAAADDGRDVERATMPDGTTRVTEIKPEKKEVIARGEKLARKPRVATYKPWSASMDEGWTRWLLERTASASKSLSPQEVQKGLAGYDAMILPDVAKDIMATGNAAPRGRRGCVTRRRCRRSTRGGLEKSGADALRKFVDGGGTLIAFGDACDYVIEEFNVPVRNALAGVKADDYQSRLTGAPAHPPRSSGDAGMPSETAAFLDSPIAFETTRPRRTCSAGCWPRIPTTRSDILLSGWINGADRLTRKAAAVAMTYGKGKIVLFGFRPQHRGQTHATFPLVFNALWWSVQP
jgi:hypothetical protein